MTDEQGDLAKKRAERVAQHRQQNRDALLTFLIPWDNTIAQALRQQWETIIPDITENPGNLLLAAIRSFRELEFDPQGSQTFSDYVQEQKGATYSEEVYETTIQDAPMRQLQVIDYEASNHQHQYIIVLTELNGDTNEYIIYHTQLMQQNNNTWIGSELNLPQGFGFSDLVFYGDTMGPINSMTNFPTQSITRTILNINHPSLPPNGGTPMTLPLEKPTLMTPHSDDQRRAA